MHVIVGTVPGSSPDIIARLMRQRLAARLGQQFIIENRPGAGGNIGTEAVVRAPADGHTLLLVTTANTISTTFYDNVRFHSLIARAHQGELRPLAVTTATHSDVLPELPTVAEVVPGYEASTWYGLGAPSNTPADVVQSLNAAVNAALAEPGMTTRLAEIGGMLLAGSPADFGRLIADETEKWDKVVKFSGAKQK